MMFFFDLTKVLGFFLISQIVLVTAHPHNPESDRWDMCFMAREWCRDQCSFMTAEASCTASCNIFRTMTWVCSSLVTSKANKEISGYISL